MNFFKSSHKKKSPSTPKKSFFTVFKEVIFGIFFALVFAIIIRQMWFELYEIPTGSMRPTFREKDHVSVTKTAFGLNIPLTAGHFYFDPTLIQRGGTLVFKGEGIKELQDGDNRYFGIIPYDKRYVKRLIGKPEDTLYFYGGKIYGIDKEGNPLQELIQDPALKDLEYIPFLSFEGVISFPKKNEVLFSLFNQPTAKMNINSAGMIKGKILKNKKWIEENSHSKDTFATFFGIENYGMTKIIPAKEVPFNEKGQEDATYYLEISHHPRLYPKKGSLAYSPLGMKLETEKSFLPLDQNAFNTLLSNMYTARFVVENGKAKRYSIGSSKTASKYLVPLPGVPDGSYEFYHGNAYKVGFGGSLSLLPKTHPLYREDEEQIVTLYNLGIEFQYARLSNEMQSDFKTNRYAYFREGDLYTLGKPLFTKNSPELTSFVKMENLKKHGFKDLGEPFQNNGSLNKAFIEEYGLKIPPKHYVVLGDNHAMSSDSRIFGFLPEKNIEGAPSLILWPFGERWGLPSQTAYPFFTIPRVFVWLVALLTICGFYFFKKKKRE